jgi:hypothetical protein
VSIAIFVVLLAKNFGVLLDLGLAGSSKTAGDAENSIIVVLALVLKAK